jgi:hypothetical protein
MSFSTTPEFKGLFASPPEPRRPLDWLIFISLIFGLLFLLLKLTACETGAPVLPTWGETPRNQQNPDSALFPTP